MSSLVSGDLAERGMSFFGVEGSARSRTRLWTTRWPASANEITDLWSPWFLGS